MYLNPKLIKENNDKDICIYTHHVDERLFPYPSYHIMSVWHEGNHQFIWSSEDGWDAMPKDGQICKICGREIIIAKD